PALRPRPYRTRAGRHAGARGRHPRTGTHLCPHHRRYHLGPGRGPHGAQRRLLGTLRHRPRATRPARHRWPVGLRTGVALPPLPYRPRSPRFGAAPNIPGGEDMNETVVFAAAGGALMAAGLWCVAQPRLTRPSLTERLQDPAPTEPKTQAERPVGTGWSRTLGAPGIPLLAALGLPTHRTRARLAACDRAARDYLPQNAAMAVPGPRAPPAAWARAASDCLAQKAAMAVLGVLVPPVVGMMLVAAGMSLAPTWAMGAWMVFALVLWTAPDLEIRDQARERSDHMRHTVA